jgi:hypothetical protein
MDFPKLIVFDFHGTLSLHTGTEKNTEFEDTLKLKEYETIRINNLKKALRKHKKTSWYQAMKDTQIDPKIMMPTLDDIIDLFDQVEQNSKDTIFGVATMGEQEDFIFDMMKYCFESKNRKSPFTMKTIIGFQNIKNSEEKSKSTKDKYPHISLIIKNSNLQNPSTVFIDDSEGIIQYMTSIGICSVLVEDYFRIEDWNKGCYKME